MRIYVGNLTYRSSERDVHKAFESYGQVTMCRLAIDPQTGRSAGFAYVEMPNEDEAQNAIARLNGKEINSRVVSVSQATVEQAPAPPERTSRPGRSSRPEGTYRDASDSRRHTTRQPRGEKLRSEQRPRSDERPVVDNPWTRRRPPQGK
ncbi:MAG: hypothetical protein KDA51_20025 [Planctomycetales bacterium]|nr:hypothetical protein [Planctomycetales bacterium]